MDYYVYSDGACSGNPGPGGYGALVMYKKEDGQYYIERELSKGYISTTNNRMELKGIIAALEAIKYPSTIKVITDSQYVVKAFEKKWINSWINKDWVRSNGPVPNKDLWIKLLKQIKRHNSVKFYWVKGHSSNEYNNLCDRMAVKASKAKELSMDFRY